MNPLGSLKSLLIKLKPDEVKSLLLFLNFQLPNPKNESKSAQLVKLVLCDPGCTAQDIQKFLYGKNNEGAFYKLVARLKDKIYEVILLNQHLDSDSYNQRNRHLFLIRKKLLQADVLFNRGIVEDVEAFLIDVKREALKLESYDILFQANVILRRYYITRRKNKLVDSISKEIALYKRNEFLFDQAGAEFNKMMNRISFSFTHHEYYKDLEVLINNLKEWYAESGSVTIGYYYLFLKLELLQSSGNYQAADDCLEELNYLLSSNSTFNTSARYGTYLLNKANNLLYLNRFTEVESFINEAFGKFLGNTLNTVLSDEVLFYSKYYLNDLEYCQIIIDRTIAQRNKIEEYILNRFRYYQAVLLFRSGAYKESLSELNSLPELVKDKEGWNVARKILQLLAKVEIGDYDSVDLNLQSLEKYLKRIRTQKHLNIRYSVILKVLIKLINEGYNYNITYHKRKKYFEMLENINDGEAQWKIKSPEFIKFHEWFKSKLL